jgi:hypothetical protein
MGDFVVALSGADAAPLQKGASGADHFRQGDVVPTAEEVFLSDEESSTVPSNLIPIRHCLRHGRVAGAGCTVESERPPGRAAKAGAPANVKPAIKRGHSRYRSPWPDRPLAIFFSRAFAFGSTVAESSRLMLKLKERRC